MTTRTVPEGVGMFVVHRIPCQSGRGCSSAERVIDPCDGCQGNDTRHGATVTQVEPHTTALRFGYAKQTVWWEVDA